MKKTLLLFCGIAAAMFAKGQANVPNSWDCAGSFPTGYTEYEVNAANSYTSSPYYLSAPAAYKIDRVNEYLKIAVNDVAGPITFHVRGTGSAPWQGTLKVQESVDSIVWTDMNIYAGAAIDATAWATHTETPLSTSRYFRFILTTKVTGYNIGLDDIDIALPAAGPAQEIAASFSIINIPNNGDLYVSSAVGTPNVTSINLENLGTVNALNVTSPITITGPAAGDFVLGAFPATIPALSNAPINYTFTPSVAGTRSAIMTIPNDDADENPFIIHLNGIGGSYASEPTTSATSMVFSNVKSYRMDVAWTAADADGYLVLRKIGGPIMDLPVDGTEYDKGQGIGSAKVFYVGAGTNFTSQEVIANTDYYYAVFPYNASGPYINYKQTSALSNHQMSSNGNIAAYYSAIDTSTSTFLTSLTSLINNHIQIFYSNYENYIIANYLTRDTVLDKMVMNCDYSGQLKQYSPPFDFTITNSSREHRMASSWMPTFGVDPNHADRYAYSDMYNLAYVNQNDVNVMRSNHAFGDVATTTASFLACKWGTNVKGFQVFEPTPDFRGDIARALFYMSTCYHNADNKVSAGTAVVNSWAWNDLLVAASFGDTAWHLASKEDQCLMKQWAALDPPSNEEIARNDYIASVQNNRNPFIDHPEWVDLIDFNTMTKSRTACTGGNIGINEASLMIPTDVYPNPATSLLNIDFSMDKIVDLTFDLRDISGKVIYTSTAKASVGNNHKEINTTKLAAGVYMLFINGDGYKSVQKVVIQ